MNQKLIMTAAIVIASAGLAGCSTSSSGPSHSAIKKVLLEHNRTNWIDNGGVDSTMATMFYKSNMKFIEHTKFDGCTKAGADMYRCSVEYGGHNHNLVMEKSGDNWILSN